MVWNLDADHFAAMNQVGSETRSHATDAASVPRYGVTRWPARSIPRGRIEEHVYKTLHKPERNIRKRPPGSPGAGREFTFNGLIPETEGS